MDGGMKTACVRSKGCPVKLDKKIIFLVQELKRFHMSILFISETKWFGESVGSVSHHGKWNYRIVPDRESFFTKGLNQHMMAPSPYKPWCVSPAIDLFKDNKTYQGMNVPPPILNNSKLRDL